MTYYDYYHRKSFQEGFQSLKHCSGDQFSYKTTDFRRFRQFMSGAEKFEDDRCGRTETPENVSRIVTC